MRKLVCGALALIALLCDCKAGASSVAIGKRPADRISIQMALFFAPAPAADPVLKLRELCQQAAMGFRVVTKGEEGTADSLPTVEAVWMPVALYAPPDERSWRYRTRDLPLTEVRPKVEASGRALVLDFVVRGRDVVEANRRIGLLVGALAVATEGLPWDEESRQLFSASAWRKSRVESWHGDTPDMREHVVMDAYRDGEFLRIVTLGMRKFALPDLVASGVIAHTSRNVGHVMNALSQVLVEGGVIQGNRLSLDFDSIKHPSVKAVMKTEPGSGGNGVVDVSLTPTNRDEGDAENELLDLDFPGSGTAKQERQQRALAALFGATDPLSKVAAGDPELRIASARARQRLPELRQRFATGLGPNESISVKGPFHADDGGMEYMWVEVTQWSDGALRGILVNDPFSVKGLKAGSQVTVKEEEVFDFIWRQSDGTVLGNETGAILQRREGQ